MTAVNECVYVCVYICISVPVKGNGLCGEWYVGRRTEGSKCSPFSAKEATKPKYSGPFVASRIGGAYTPVALEGGPH